MTATVTNPNDPSTESVVVNLVRDVVPIIGQDLWIDQVGDVAGGGWLAVATPPEVERPKVRVQKTGDAAISNATITTVSFSNAGVKYDIDNMFDDALSTTRITFNWPGKYGFGANIFWQDDAGAVGRRLGDIIKNGGNIVASHRHRAQTTDDTNIIASELNFAAGDYIELSVFQSSGGPLNVINTQETSPVFWASYID